MVEGGKVIHVHSIDEYNKCLSEWTGLVVVDFSATWCPPCRMIAPIYEKLAPKYPNALLLHVDVEELEGLPEAKNVTGIPTFKFFKGGNKLEEFAGANAQRVEDSIVAHQ